MIAILLIALFAGGGAVFNEHLLKSYLKIPRPNITWLASDLGNQALGMSTEEFYIIGDKQDRRKPLASAINQAPISLSSAIKPHWIEETGYSFPSGHAFSALFFTTFLPPASLGTCRVLLQTRTQSTCTNRYSNGKHRRPYRGSYHVDFI